MTNAQRKEYKLANQVRKLRIIKHRMSYYVGTIQNGRHTALAMNWWKSFLRSIAARKGAMTRKAKSSL